MKEAGYKGAGLIDMGGAVAGDPRLDLAISRYYFPAEMWPALAQGYGEISRDPAVEKYLLLVAARKVIYRHRRNFIERMPSALQYLQYALKLV